MVTPSAVTLGVKEKILIRSAPSTVIVRPARTETRCRNVSRKNPACTAAPNPTAPAIVIAMVAATPTTHRRGETLIVARLDSGEPRRSRARVTIRYSRSGFLGLQ